MPKNKDGQFKMPSGSKKFVETTDTLLDLMTQEVMGIDPANKSIIDNDDDVSKINSVLKAIEGKYSTNYESVDDKVLSIKNVDGTKSVADDVNALLDMNKMQYAFNSADHRNIVKLIREYNFICDNMPQALKAISKVAKMTLSPNRQTGVSINISDFTITKMQNNKNGESVDYKTFDDAEKVRDFLTKKYKLPTLILGAVTDSYKHAYKFVVTIPNRDIAKDLLSMGAINLNDIGDKHLMGKVKTIRESISRLDKWQSGNVLFKESVVKPIADADGKVPVEVLDAFSELMPVTPYPNEAINKTLHSIMSATGYDENAKGLRIFGEAKKSNIDRNETDMIRGHLYGDEAGFSRFKESTSKDYRNMTEEEMVKMYKENLMDLTGTSNDFYAGKMTKKADVKISKTIESIKGCYVKALEPEKVVPIKINDQLIGLYYLESTPMATSAIRGHITPMQSRPNGEDIRAMQKNLVETAIRFIRTELSEKFVDVNQNVMGHIYELMTSHLNIGAAFRVRFFPAKYVHDFSNYQLHPTIPNSLLALAAPLAKEYILLSRNHIMNRLYNEKDRIVQFYNASKSPDIKKLAKASMSIMQRLYPNLVQLMDMGFISQSTTDSYVLVSPMNGSGDKIINYERLEGQKPTDENERLETLEESVTTMIGYTYSLGASKRKEYMSATEVVGMDAERTGEVMDAQAQFRRPIEDLARFIVETELASDESIVEFNVKLERPASFDDEVNLTTIQKTVDVAGKLAESLVPPDEAKKDAIVAEFVKLYLKDSIDPKYFSLLKKAERAVQQQGKADGANTDELDLGDSLDF